MNTLQGDGATSAIPSFPTFQTGLFDMEAMSSPYAWAAPFWSFYAAAAQTGLAMWSAGFSVRPFAMEQAFAEAQKAVTQPIEALAAVEAPAVLKTQKAAQAAVQAPAKAAKAPIKAVPAAIAEMPTRVETAGEPEPAMVGGEAAPISPVIAATPQAK